MMDRRHILYSVFISVALLLFCQAGLNGSSHSPFQSASSNDNDAIRSLVSTLYSTYSTKDIEKWTKCWSAKAPGFAERKLAQQKFFADYDRIEVTNLNFEKIEVAENNASLNVTLEMNAWDKKTGKQTTAFGKMNRTIELIREASSWKVWTESSAEDALVGKLLQAKTEGERTLVLNSNLDLMTVELRKALATEALKHIQHSDFGPALMLYQVALALAEKISDQAGIIAVTTRLGAFYRIRGNYQVALEYLQRALKLARESGDKDATADVLNNIAGVYDGRGEFALALTTLREALPLSQQAGNKHTQSLIFNSAAIIYAKQGDYENSLTNFQSGLKLQEELGNQPYIAVMLGNMGNVYRHQGNYGQALEVYQRSLKMQEAAGDKSSVAQIMNNIGNVYFFQSDYDLALDFYRRSLSIKEGMGERESSAVNLGNIGNVYREQGVYAQALEFYRRALEINQEFKSKSRIPSSMNSMGSVLLLQENYPQALSYSQQALDLSISIGDQVDAITSLHQIALTHLAEKDFRKALDAAEKATVLARQVGEREELWGIRLVAGRAYRGLGQIEDAREALNESIETIEGIRSDVAGGEQQRQSFFADKLAPYREMVDLLITQNKVDEAFAFAEHAKARVLLDVLHSGKANLSKALTASEKDLERNLKAQMVFLNAQLSREQSRPQLDEKLVLDLKDKLQKARLDYESFQTNLYASHPELRVQRGEAQTIKADETIALLPDPKTALLEYVVTSQKTYLFVLQRNKNGNREVSVKVIALDVPETELAKQAEKFRSSLASRDLAFREPSRDLYNLLIKPAVASLADKTTLIIVPDGVLWQLPFQGLQSSAGHFLLEDFAISYAPSLTVLGEMMKRSTMAQTATSNLLAVGNPTVNVSTAEHAKSVKRSEDLGPLPEAEKEVQVLGQLYRDSRNRIYIGNEAQEGRIKSEAGKFSVLHFATHASLNDASPMYSHLVLSQSSAGEDEDGLLETWEIMNLDLQAKLVVLSACETGRGRISAGEGIIGLSWAVFVAGCPTTVVSQWKVDSASTTELMLNFHRALRNGNAASATSTARALQSAALKLLKTKAYSHPFYWAGFVVVGDGR